MAMFARDQQQCDGNESLCIFRIAVTKIMLLAVKFHFLPKFKQICHAEEGDDDE